MSIAAFSLFGTAGATALIAGQSSAPAPAGLGTVTTSTAVTSSAAVSTTATTPVTSSATATPTSNCPSAVRITLGSITVSGSTVTITFTHTGLECPDAAASTLHVHENLLRTPHSGSDPIQLNRDFAITPGFGNSVTVPLLAAVDGKCFVQVDAHANGVARGQFFPTETCPTSSVTPTPSQSISASSSTKPPSSTPAGTTPAVASHSVLPESSTSPSTAALATTGTSLQDPLWIAGLLVLLGIGLLVLVQPPSRRH